MSTRNATYRQNLPQLGQGSFITDGGLETVFVFHEKIDLPVFAASGVADLAEVGYRPD